MSMFFYRPWVRKPGDEIEDNFNYGRDSSSYVLSFTYYSWGYLVLLGITLAASLLLNGLFLISFFATEDTSKRKHKEMLPHYVLLCLSIRDIMLTVLVIPTAIAWFVVGAGVWKLKGGAIWCKISSFLDFSLTAALPLLLMSFAIILLTRSVEKPTNEIIDLDLDEATEPSINDNLVRDNTSISRSIIPPRASSDINFRSNEGRRTTRLLQGDTRKYMQHSGGSVTASIEGRMALGKRHGMSRVEQLRSGAGFRTSSPLAEADESLDNTRCSDLWDSASLDYPGRFDDYEGKWEDDDYELESHPKGLVNFHGWHLWLLASTWIISLAFGIPATILVEHFPNTKPGCYIYANPFKTPNSITINDPAFNFLLSFAILCYVIPAIILLFSVIRIILKKTRGKEYKSYVATLGVFSIMFAVTSSANYVLGLKGLIEAARGFTKLNFLPYEVEYEILLVWSTFIPTFLSPVIYFSIIPEFRRNLLNVTRRYLLCAEQKQAKPLEIDSKTGVGSKTQITHIL